MEKDVERILFSKEQLQNRVQELGKKISEDYNGKNLLVIGLLKGSFIFMADLLREITIPVDIDFFSLSSYSGMNSTGTVLLESNIKYSICGKDILVIEDILDTGLTLDYIIKLLGEKKPASINICTLLYKSQSKKTDLVPKYFGFDIPNEFVVGYGLDYNQKYRNLPYVGILNKKFMNIT